MTDYYEDYCPEPDLEIEPEAWHRMEIWDKGDYVLVCESTNDNLDRGYSSEYASWQLRFENVEAALKHTGKSRQGYLCRVYVYLNGEQI